MKILITGGSGFIGSNLALRLVAEGHHVSVIDNLSPQIHGQNPDIDSPLYSSIKGVVDFIHGSICDAAMVEKSIEGQDAIVHLAAETGTGQSMYEIRRYVDVNIGGTALLLDLLARHPHQVRRLVIASSRAIYGEGKYQAADGSAVYPDARLSEDLLAGHFNPRDSISGKPLKLLATDEQSKIHPASVYGITKQNQEQMVMTVCPSLGIEPVALRYQNVYGPGQSLKNPYTGILSIFSTRILNKNPINIFEDGLESRDFIYIDDIVEATCLALFRPEAAGQVFGIGSGVPTTVLKVAEMLVAQYGKSVPISVTGAFRVGDIRHNYADITKARKLLGFEPKVSFEKGIEKFAQWVLTQEVSEDSYDKSIRELAEKGLYKQ